MTALPSGGGGLFQWFNESFLELGKLVSPAVEAGRVSHPARAHHGSLRPWGAPVLQKCSQGEMTSGYRCPVPGIWKFSQVPTPGIAGRQKTCSQVTQEVCGGAVNQYPDNQIYMVPGEHTMHSGQDVNWVKEGIIGAGA